LVQAVLVFEDRAQVSVILPTRPLQGEWIHFDGDRYMVKSVAHHATTSGAQKPPVLEVQLGAGRGGSHPYLMEKSPKGFFSG